MRLIPQLLTMLLAITSIAVPCFASTQIDNSNSIELVSGEVDAGVCRETFIKAIVSRQDSFDQTITVPRVSGDFTIASARQNHFLVAKFAAVFKPPNAICDSSVNLYALCRQLN